MLTSFFGNSKPVHFLMLGGFLTFCFFWTYITDSPGGVSIHSLPIMAMLLGVSLFSVILLDFIVSKNLLARRNAYSIFFYSCFIGMFPVVFLTSEMLLAQFFLLLAVRRIVSLRNDTNSEKKILDGGIWITVASLFHFWSLLFFIPLWLAVIQKPSPTYKQMLIPLVGFFAVVVINTAFQLVVHDSFAWFFGWKQPIGYDFSKYNSEEIFVPLTLVLGLLVWAGFYRLQHLVAVPLKERANYWMLFFITAVSIVIALCSEVKNGSEIIFLFAPTAILCANYIEGIQSDGYRQRDKVETWFKEILLWIVVIFSLFFLLL